MNKYERGKIYSIRSRLTDEVYIGSTIQPLSIRLGKHRNSYKRYLEGKYHYVSSFKLLELGDYHIELVEDCPCESKEQLNRREGELIRSTENCVNMMIPGRTISEYREDNKEIIAQREAQYRADNKEAIAQYNTQYYQDHKQKIAQYYQENKERMAQKNAQYKANNKEAIAQYNTQYYEENKEKLKQKYTCECGSTTRIDAKARHERTIKHQEYHDAQYNLYYLFD
jgi:hypothetical protein